MTTASMTPRVQIAAHRGLRGGNIVENTLPAFEAALRCGADIVETDVRKTKDGIMVLFHDPSPLRLLELPGQVSDYTLAELRSRPLRNSIGEPSGSFVNTLEELLHALKGRCGINLDQCWGFLDEVYAVVERLGMADQALIKGRAPYDGAVAWLTARSFQPAFIPVITCTEDIVRFDALPSAMNIPMVEVFFRQEDDPTIAPAFVKRLRDRGIGLWVNALDLGGTCALAAGHTDTVSVLGDHAHGWGWLVAHGASVIQTDWPSELHQFLSASGKR